MSNEHTEQSEASRYPQVVRTISETPWAIMPETMAVIREFVALRAKGERFTKEEIQARVGSSQARRDLQMAGTVALIPVYGVITPKADLFSEMSGGTSVERLQATFRDALADGDVTAIVLDVSSPGGSVGLLPELAAEIRNARGTKPIVAIANTRAASAAYWIASQADEVVVTPSGDVGSVGVFAAHEDISALQEALGVKTTLISAGKFKTEGNPFEPLTDDALAAIQERIDETYAQFVADVAAGRGIDASKVEADFGQGRMLTARNALRAGMVDRVDTFEATVHRLMKGDASPVPLIEKDPLPTEPADGGDDEGSRRRIRVEIVGDASSLETALRGRSFADEAAGARDVLGSLVDRTRSLAEFARGRLTTAKRDQLGEVLASLDLLEETRAALHELLAATDHEHDDAPDGIGLEAELAFQRATALNL